MAEGKYQEFVGRPTGRSVITVERGPVANFAKSLKDDNPVYQRVDVAREQGFVDLPAPPTWAFAMAHWGTFPEQQPPADGSTDGPSPLMEIMGSLMKEGGIILHGEQEFEYHKPLVAGMTLRQEGKVADVYAKESKGATMTFVITENQYRDESGDLVLTARMNLIHRS